jgi:membrane protease YdiL (CAAX protease family)
MARPTGTSAANYLGLTLPRKRDLIIGVLIVTVAGAALDGGSKLLGLNPVTEFQFDIYRSARAEGWLPWLWLAIVVVGPIGEETLFRGFPVSRLASLVAQCVASNHYDCVALGPLSCPV